MFFCSQILVTCACISNPIDSFFRVIRCNTITNYRNAVHCKHIHRPFFFFHEVTISDYEGRVFLFLGERIMLLALNIESFELKA